MTANCQVNSVLGEAERLYHSKENTSGKAKEGQAFPLSRGNKEKEDPFGDVLTSEVKYRTMEWW